MLSLLLEAWHKASVVLNKTVCLVYVTAMENTHLKASWVQKPLTGKLERTHHTDRGVLLCWRRKRCHLINYYYSGRSCKRPLEVKGIDGHLQTLGKQNIPPYWMIFFCFIALSNAAIMAITAYSTVRPQFRVMHCNSSHKHTSGVSKFNLCAWRRNKLWNMALIHFRKYPKENTRADWLKIVFLSLDRKTEKLL